MTTDQKPIQFWNRYSQKIETENVYGGGLIRWLYTTKSGQALSPFLVKPLVTKTSGFYQNSTLSAFGITNFIKKFAIPMSEYEPGPYKSFNEFFIRQFKKGARPFIGQNTIMPAFSEGRYLGFESVNASQTFPVKGEFLSAEKILGSSDEAKPFEGGPLLISRLCPVDYHRFHYPDDGRTDAQYRLHGDFHSMNPAALKFKGDIFSTNERHVSILKTNNFGKLAYVEVGAFFVGKIVQTHLASTFRRGDEKGYFLFGGSTVILMGEPGQWVPDSDILKQSQQGLSPSIV